MKLIDDIKMYGRFLLGLRRFLHNKISLEQAQAIVKKHLAQREANFLRLVERGIYGYSKSPYRPLLKLAGCELGDIFSTVRTKGLEEALRLLREAGVYISFEEFKGRKPIVRNGRVIPVQSGDFDNPFLSRYYYGESGGTTGAGTRIQIDLDHLAAQAPDLMLTRNAHGVLDVPTAIWYGVLPDNTGLGALLRQARFGHLADKWFTPVSALDLQFNPKNIVATHMAVLMARLLGAPFPRPELLRLNQAELLANWAAQMLKSHGRCLIRSHVSPALRVCIAARRAGIDLTGVTFMGGGEPPTEAKIRELTRTGARYVPTYFFNEFGAVGLGCACPTGFDDLHFLMDALALIQYPRQVPGFGFTVDAFHFTSLLPTAPRLMLNVESDDFGVVEQRSCGCPLETLGLTTHIRQVRSFRKLTGEGITLVASEMIHILEEVLPARFGGSPLDYQLLEEENEKGLTQICLLVSPDVEIKDEKVLIQTVFKALKKSTVAADLAQTIWKQTESLKIKRMDPVSTRRGKLMPLHVAKQTMSMKKN